MQLHTVTFNDSTFQINPLPLFKRISLDVRMAKVFAPFLASLGFQGTRDLNSMLDGQVDFASLAGGVTEALSSLGNAEFTTLIKDILVTTTCIKDGTAPFVLDSEKALEKAFEDGHHYIYQVAMEVLKHHRIVPFVVLGGGPAT